MKKSGEMSAVFAANTAYIKLSEIINGHGLLAALTAIIDANPKALVTIDARGFNRGNIEVIAMLHKIYEKEQWQHEGRDIDGTQAVYIIDTGSARKLIIDDTDAVAA